jgi:hypothetical protein
MIPQREKGGRIEAERTSTVKSVARPLMTGKMKKLSGVVRSVNHKAPPSLNEGTFSAMFLIYNHHRIQLRAGSQSSGTSNLKYAHKTISQNLVLSHPFSNFTKR